MGGRTAYTARRGVIAVCGTGTSTSLAGKVNQKICGGERIVTLCAVMVYVGFDALRGRPSEARRVRPAVLDGGGGGGEAGRFQEHSWDDTLQANIELLGAVVVPAR